MIFDKRSLQFERLGFMVDCSRGAVPKVETLKKFVDYLSAFGYTYLELYTEDTYEIEGEKYFGYMRGRYTKAEIKDLSSYCKQKNMELVPCIQTLAHLERIKKYSDYHDLFEIDNILNVDDDRAIALIEKMFESCREMYSSDRIHIGMDEAHLLGRGKLLDKNGIEERGSIMHRHLKKVADIAQKHGYICEMWSDMFTSSAAAECTAEDRAIVPCGSGMPENTEPVMWCYWKQSDEELNEFILKNKALGKNTVFAGGAHKWEGFVPDNQFSINITKKQIKACIENGVNGYMLTGWGDGAADASIFSILPSVFAAAVFAHGQELIPQVTSKFEKVVGTSFDAFMLLDKPNKPENKEYTELNNQSFIYCYSDVLQGTADSIVQPDAKVLFTKVSEEIRRAKCGKDFKYLFSAMKAFTDFVAEKSTIGKRAYESYIAKEPEGIKNVIKRLDNAIKLLDKFIKEYTVQWLTENKPFGLEKQQVRLGGLKLRLEYALDTLKTYLSGKASVIPEFEQQHLPLGLWVMPEGGFTCDNSVVNDFNSLISGGSLM